MIDPKPSKTYWSELDKLVASNGFVIERPKGSAHPKYPDYIYPLDYGFIADTTSSDGAEIDAWKGTLTANNVTGVAATFDSVKQDMEVKILIDCSSEDKQAIIAAHSRGSMSAIIIDR